MDRSRIRTLRIHGSRQYYRDYNSNYCTIPNSFHDKIPSVVLYRQPLPIGRFIMLFKVASDIVILIHFAWILFIILGFPIFFYFNMVRWRLFHMLALTATIMMQLSHTICPLTYLEAYLKSKDIDSSVYPGSFIIESIEDLMYVQDVTLGITTYITIGFFVVVLLSFRFRPLRKKLQ